MVFFLSVSLRNLSNASSFTPSLSVSPGAYTERSLLARMKNALRFTDTAAAPESVDSAVVTSAMTL